MRVKTEKRRPVDGSSGRWSVTDLISTRIEKAVVVEEKERASAGGLGRARKVEALQDAWRQTWSTGLGILQPYSGDELGTDLVGTTVFSVLTIE